MNRGVANELRLIRSSIAKISADQTIPLHNTISAFLDEIIAEEEADPIEFWREAKKNAPRDVRAALSLLTDGSQGAKPSSDRRAFDDDASRAAIREVLHLDQKAWLGMAAATGQVDQAHTSAEMKPLDRARLEEFLRVTFGDELIHVLALDEVPAGTSKRTAIATLGERPGLPSKLAIRMDITERSFLGTTVVQEFPLVSRLYENGVRVPRPYVLEPTGSVLGGPFIISDFAKGSMVGRNYVDPPRNPQLILNVGHLLAPIHRVPFEGLDLPGAHSTPEAAVASAVENSYADWRLLNMYHPTMEACFRWVKENIHRAEGPAAFVHNDYNFNNLLVEDSTVQAVLDWELSYIGTPAADLGYFHYSAEAGGSFELFLDAYREAGGTVPPKETLDFYILWGQLKLAVQLFQCVVMLKNGEYDDLRFSSMLSYRHIAMKRLSEKLLELIG